MFKVGASVMALCCLLGNPVAAETRCHDIMEQDCNNRVCDNKGNCVQKCYPKTRKVCEEISPPPQTTQPTGGLLNDRNGKPDGAWGGVTIPIR